MNKEQEESVKVAEQKDTPTITKGTDILEDPRMVELIQLSEDNNIPMIVSVSNPSDKGIYGDLFTNMFALGRGNASTSLMIATIASLRAEIMESMKMPEAVLDGYIALVSHSRQIK
jgi:hypothetical protein